MPNLDAEHPFVDQSEVSLATAEATVGYTIPVPSDPIANTDNLTRTFVASGKKVGLVFGKGDVTITMFPAEYSDALGEFQDFVKHTTASASVQYLGDIQALVIEPKTDSVGANASWIEFEDNGLDVNVISWSYSPTDLLSVAASMTPNTR